ncbi:MAG TPA: membrane lipoprotein lipid attachment site-containing protein [bacterium]
MKKILLALFAMLVLAGCGGGGHDDLTVADMAGTYAFSEASVTQGGTTVTLLPPTISGSLTLGADSRYALDAFIGSQRFLDSGAFSVSDPNIVLVSTDGTGIAGTIGDDGRTVILSDTSGGSLVTLEFTRI